MRNTNVMSINCPQNTEQVTAFRTKALAASYMLAVDANVGFNFPVCFRKASLALIRKMVHYSSEVLLKEVCDSETGHHLPTVLVEITATVLDQEVQSHVRFVCDRC